MIETISLYSFVFFSLILIVFQLALAFGAPWGAASMGGRFPGVYPPKMRFVAVLNALVIAFMAAIVSAFSGFAFSFLTPIASWAIWIVVGFYGLSILANTATPSKIERIWAPVALLQTAAALYLALH
jgi:hypothetical protein